MPGCPGRVGGWWSFGEREEKIKQYYMYTYYKNERMNSYLFFVVVKMYINYFDDALHSFRASHVRDFDKPKSFVGS